MGLSDWLLRHIPDDRIAAYAEEHDEMPAFTDPIDTLYKLPDEPGNVYLWEVGSESRAAGWRSELESYQEDQGHIDAIHFILADGEEIHEYTKEDLRMLIE